MNATYCWCGHVRFDVGIGAGHQLTADGVIVCDGICPPNKPMTNCRCDTFVPAEVAMFRMVDQVHAQLIDFKMLVAMVTGAVKPQEPSLIKKVN